MRATFKFTKHLMLLIWFLIGTSIANGNELQDTIAEFSSAKSFKQVEAVIEKLAELGDPAAAISLRALSDGELKFRKSDGAVFVVTGGSGGIALKDAISGDPVESGAATAKDFKKVRVKNSIRRKIAAVLSGMTLQSSSVERRLAGARTIFETSDASALSALEEALKSEENEDVRTAFLDARASAILASDRSTQDKQLAIERISQRADRASLSLLSKFKGKFDNNLNTSIDQAIADMEASQAVWANVQNIWYGISLGSVLLLAAIGLAITFGVMGVINMAHGEMVMLGAYTTFTVQQVILAYAPDLMPFALLFALPMAFLVSGLIGLVMERGLIRRLYGRPLETLLATWGVSLILQQLVRTIYGPTNREVSNPSWMSGAFDVGQVSITWNRLWIVIFAPGRLRSSVFRHEPNQIRAGHARGHPKPADGRCNGHSDFLG